MRTQLLRWSDRPQHLCVKSVLVAGSLLLLLTAIFPERYDADGQLLSQSLEALCGYLSTISRLSRLYHSYISATSRLYLGERGEHLAASRAAFGCIRLHSLPSYLDIHAVLRRLCTLPDPRPEVGVFHLRRSSTCSV